MSKGSAGSLVQSTTSMSTEIARSVKSFSHIALYFAASKDRLLPGHTRMSGKAHMSGHPTGTHARIVLYVSNTDVHKTCPQAKR